MKPAARMDSAALAAFLTRVHHFFRGHNPLDAELLRLALPQITASDPVAANQALDRYAVAHGGERARFIPSYFFAALDLVLAAPEVTPSASAQAARNQAARTVEAVAIDADWSAVRTELARAPAHQLQEAVATLVRLGWREPPQDVAEWSRAWLVTCAGLIRGDLPTQIDANGKLVESDNAAAFYARVGRMLAR